LWKAENGRPGSGNSPLGIVKFTVFGEAVKLRFKILAIGWDNAHKKKKISNIEQGISNVEVLRIWL
jgi:hypothetical protein